MGQRDGNIKWEGYGIQSIKTFLCDVLALEMKQKSLKDLEIVRPSFKESLLSTAVIEAAHNSLNDDSAWKSIELVLVLKMITSRESFLRKPNVVLIFGVRE